MHQRCPYCHEEIPAHEYPAHIARHTKLRSDGQMTDHVTVRPEERYRGDLDGVPTWYRHDKCGAVTGMPEEIVRSYLSDPFLYSDYTFCTGCNDYPHQSEFCWVDTGENLHEYHRRLRREYVERNNLDPNDFVWKNGSPERRKRNVGGQAAAGGCLVALVALAAVGGLMIVGVVGVGVFLNRAANAPAQAPAGVRAPANVAPVAVPAPPKVAPVPAPAPPSIAPPNLAPPSFDPGRDASRRMEEMHRRMEQHRQESQRQLDRLRDEMKRPPGFRRPGF